MAEQYASFQGKEPEIDVNLFVNALTQGIAAGNAQKTTFGAIAEGVKEGIGGGIKTAQGIQQIRANAAELEVAEDPAVIQAKKDKAVADAQIAQAEAKTKATEDASIALAKVAQAKTIAAQAEQKLGDIKVENTISEALGRRSPEELNSILNDPNAVATMRRNTEFGNQVLGGMQGVADPALISQVRNQIDAVELQKQRANMLDDQAKRKQIASEKNNEEFTQSQYSLQGLQGVSDVMNGSEGKFNPSKLKIYPEDTVNIINGQLESVNGSVVKKPQLGPMSADKGYVVAYGDKILDTLNHDEGRNYNGILENFKKGAAARPDLYPQSAEVESLPADAATAVRSDGLGLARGTPAPVQLPAAATNAEIVAAARQRNETYKAKAAANGQGSSYQGLMTQGSQLSRANAPKPSVVSTLQSTPVAVGTIPLTQPVQTPTANLAAASNDSEVRTFKPGKSTYHPIDADLYLAEVMGFTTAFNKDTPNDTPQYVGTNLNIDRFTPGISRETFEKVESIPALFDKAAMFKGMVAVESGGDPNARSPVGALGLFQFMEPAASDVGLAPEERTDPEKAVRAGIEYYSLLETQISRYLSNQGLPARPDPRMVLAAYNGGAKYIKNGIAAGNTTWDEMKSYIESVKTPGATKENLAYPDKVILASIPFIVGGNASDDNYIQTLIAFGILDVPA